MNNNQTNRRRFIRSSAFGLIGISAFGNATVLAAGKTPLNDDEIFYRYPCLNDELVSGIVGAAHTNFDKVKELVSQRPELATASWDWGFGDWETALGAASHMGRRDIAELLMSYGARADIFTMAMLGSYAIVKNMIETIPGIQSKPGPHGITLLQHAKNRLRVKDITEEDTVNANKLIAYLEGLGNADEKAKSLDITDEEKQKYLGDYRFGKKEDEIFTIDLNMRKLLQIGRKGYFGRVMNKTDATIFSPGGAPSVSISFAFKNEKAVSLTIHEPQPLVTAIRI